MRSFACFLLLGLFSVPTLAADKPLVIHEWGTFTSLQNEKGEAIGGINTDDEPVPAFVHSLDSSLIDGSTSAEQIRTKGVFRLVHPDITMRLETPVVYFYRPAGSGPVKLDLSVTFHGGYLSQYYPNVTGPSPVVTQDFTTNTYKPVTSQTTHTITWPNLQIGTEGVGPKTTDRVWTAPREVKADNVMSEKGESEKFLFYRGVGHLDSPLRIVQKNSQHFVMAWQENGLKLDASTELKQLWLVQINADGKVAFRKLSTVLPAARQARRSMAEKLSFDPADFSTERLKELRDAMRDALVGEGLFPDEADAMLNTWEASYFKSPGLRVFYIVPRQWTDQILPMTVSVPAEIIRVMVGRIELVSPSQQAMLKTIADPKDLPQLGRFTAALLNDEEARNPSPRLLSVINAAGLVPAKIAR